MPDKLKNKLAQSVYESDYGSRINVALINKFKLSSKKAVMFRDIINDVLFNKIKIKDLDKQFKNKLKITPQRAKDLAKEVVGRKFLILDDHFKGAASKYLAGLGANPEDYNEVVDKFRKEIEIEEEMVKRLTSDEDKMLEDKVEAKKEMEKAPPLELRDPEKEEKDLGAIFSDQVVDLLKWADFRTKLDLNSLIVMLFLEKEESQTSFLQKLVNNQEILTQDKIQVNNQTVDPTIGNWLKDFIAIVGVEGTVSSIKKAKYMAESQNAKKLDREEGQLLDMTLDLYVAIRNFFYDVQRKNVEDIAIFPFTDKDVADIEASVKEHEKVAKEKAPPPKDIFELYVGSPEEQKRIEMMKEKMIEATNGDLKKISDELEVGFLKKDKIKTIASLMILVEQGGFIKLLIEDIRYRDYLTSYLNRIGKANLVNDFVVNPAQPQFVVYILKYILQERLELTEEEAARIATHFDTHYTRRGEEKFSRLAFYDMAEKKFKWA